MDPPESQPDLPEEPTDLPPSAFSTESALKKKRRREPVLLTDDLKCGICCEGGREVVRFPCMQEDHVACRTCVATLAEDNGDVRCFGCQRVFPGVAADDLEPDPFFASLAKRLVVGCR